MEEIVVTSGQVTFNFIPYWSEKINILGVLLAQGMTTGTALSCTIPHLDTDGVY